MLHFIRAGVAIAITCSLMHLVSCAGSVPAIDADSLPLLAGLDSRFVSGTADVSATGSEALAFSPGAVVQGTNLSLSAGQGGMEWAIYRLQPPAGMLPQSTAVTLADPGTDEAWVAVGNYAGQRWEFSGPYAAPAAISGLGSDHVSPNGYVYLAVVVSDGHAGVVEGISLTSEANFPPVASLTATPQSGAPATPVILDASGSYDPDGSIVNFEWDLDDDGVFELNNGSDSTAYTELPDPIGTKEVGVRVTDDGGATATFYLELSNWTIVTIDSLPTATDYAYIFNSLAVVDNKPAIGYYDYNSYDLKYAYSSTADGSSGWTTTTVDATGTVGEFLSLAVVDGKPAISYYDGTNRDLKYAYSSTADGSGAWTTVTVDSFGDIGRWTSLAMVDGKPAISYMDGSNADLKYAYSSTADGSSGWTTLVADPLDGPGGSYTSLAVVNGKPAISYMGYNPNKLKYAFSSATNGASGWTSLILDSGDGVGYAPSLEMVNGLPAIAYLAQVGGDGFIVKYARSSDPDGNGGWTSIATTLGYWTSLAVVDGKPAIATVDGYSGALKFAETTSLDGGWGWHSHIVDAGEFNAADLAVVDGKPAMSYSGAGQLKYAVGWH